MTMFPGIQSLPSILIVGASLNPKSRSQKLAREFEKRLVGKGLKPVFLDLREHPLPLAGSGESWSAPGLEVISNRVRQASHILFAVPIYNFDVNAAAKNFVELVGKEGFEGKTVGFICSAGGRSSYMSVMSFANALMLDFRCWIVPRFLYVDKDFDGANPDPEISERLDLLLTEFVEA